MGAQTTDLLLVLAADVSRSIDESEFALQRKGYSAAVTDPRVLAAIRGGATGTIAICFVEWSGAGEQNVVADWTVIRDEEDAGGLAAAILAAPRSFIGRTSISGAIDFAMERFAAAQPRASRHIIDISGDGTNNSGRPVTDARDQAVGQGVTINGLAIVNDKPNPGYAFHTQPPGGLARMVPAERHRRPRRFSPGRRGFSFLCRRDDQQAGQRNRRGRSRNSHRPPLRHGGVPIARSMSR